MKLSKKFKGSVFFKENWWLMIFFISLFFFSWWLMWHTFSYQGGGIKIAAKAWSDFAAHLPLIRSFSWGSNFPPEYPIFPGEPIRYHFLFYALVGLMEKAGLPLDWALNLPSAFSFFLLLGAIFLFANFLFKKKAIAFLSVIFFLFNSSFAFLYFFKERPIFSFQSILDIFNNQSFPAFAPYDQSLISGGFWNLNVFTNQRHFAFALALLLIIALITLKKINQKKFPYSLAILTGLFIGVLPFLHGAVLIMALTIFGGIFLFFPFKKQIFLTLLVALLIAFPQILYLKSGQPSVGLSFNPGYLVANNLTLFTFLRYWFLNLGLGFFLIPLGFFLSNRFSKKIFLVFGLVFLIGNLFQFGPDIATNHKFFNLWLIVANMFTALALFKIWQKKIWGKILVLVFVFFLTLSGLIDFFAIKNDTQFSIIDAPDNPDISWIKNNTSPKDIFLNTAYLYHPASLAGRKIFLGWPYFAWSAGYDTHQRDALRKEILSANENDKSTTCQKLTKNNLDFVSLRPVNSTEFQPNFSFWENKFVKVYNNAQTGFTIFSVEKSCL